MFLNKEAKMMILLGSVNGTIKELDFMREIRRKNIRCSHYDNKVFPCMAEARLAKPMNIEHENVYLGRDVMYYDTKVGKIARCSCGRIYFSIGNIE